MEKYSFKGWDFKIWVTRNKDNLRLILSGLFGLLTVFLSGLTTPWAVGLGTIVTAISKLFLDSLDYYISE